MKRISECFNNPGNDVKLGVTNHYTPIDNIVMNVRNIFGALLGLVVSKGEDGVSLKIQSSAFTTPEATENIIFSSTFDGRTYLGGYIKMQGLQGFKIIDLGGTCIAYFFPTDLSKGQCKIADIDKTKCKEMKESHYAECEMFGRITESNDEEELEDMTAQELAEIFNSNDKVKAAIDFDERLQHVVSLPPEMYIKATKDAQGRESIALRFKKQRRRPFGGNIDVVTSLLNIYGTGNDAVWVDAYLNKDEYKQDVLDVIEAILKYIGAEETSDEAVFTINGDKKKEEGGKNSDEDDEKENNDIKTDEPEEVKVDKSKSPDKNDDDDDN